MTKFLSLFVFFLSVILGSTALLCPLAPPVFSQPNPVIQSQETDFPGAVAELIQWKRKKGVLTVKVRVKKTASKGVKVFWADAKKTVYLMDEENQKKYFLLKDATGEYIYSGSPGAIQPNASKTSWFKFPAPPPEVEEITIILPSCLPFEDVLIEDK